MRSNVSRLIFCPSLLNSITIVNFSSVSKMYNCQNSKEIEPLKPSIDLFQVDENCIFESDERHSQRSKGLLLGLSWCGKKVCVVQDHRYDYLLLSNVFIEFSENS